jgi:hypothetical protein
MVKFEAFVLDVGDIRVVGSRRVFDVTLLHMKFEAFVLDVGDIRLVGSRRVFDGTLLQIVLSSQG